MTGNGASAVAAGPPRRGADDPHRDGRPGGSDRRRGGRAPDRRRRHRLRQPAQRDPHRARPTSGRASPRCTWRTRRMPKRCGHLDGKQLVPPPRARGQGPAAVAARGPVGPLIIGRTDAVSVEGLDADARAGPRPTARPAPTCCSSRACPTSPPSAAGRGSWRAGRWCSRGWRARCPPLTPSQLGELGVSVVIFPITGGAGHDAHPAADLCRTGRAGAPRWGSPGTWPRFEEFSAFMGADEAAAIEERFSSG